jgi:hypothetical protein
MSAYQLNMFGEPEPLDNLSAQDRLRDDAPVPAERELLWPADMVELLGVERLERLYGDVPRRTRLRVKEVCRRARISTEHLRRLIEEGSIDATNVQHPDAYEPAYRPYRYSVVRWLFNRDFIATPSPCCNLPAEDLQAIDRAVEILKNRNPKRRNKG